MGTEKRTRRSLFDGLADALRRLFRREPEAPGDPYAYRTAPVRSGPGSRRGAAAVEEPREEDLRKFPPRIQ